MAAAFRLFSSTLRRPLACRQRFTRLFTMAALMSMLLLAAGATRADAQEVIEYYGTDALGSIRVVFAPDGTVKARSDYLPFGEEWGTTTPGGPLPSQRFTGQQRDAEETLEYFNARSLQTRIGRFTTVDPAFGTLFEPQSWNRYAYVRNRPSYFTDPTGMQAYVDPAEDITQLEGSWCRGNRCFVPPVGSGPSFGNGRAPGDGDGGGLIDTGSSGDEGADSGGDQQIQGPDTGFVERQPLPPPSEGAVKAFGAVAAAVAGANVAVAAAKVASPFVITGVVALSNYLSRSGLANRIAEKVLTDANKLNHIFQAKHGLERFNMTQPQLVNAVSYEIARLQQNNAIVLGPNGVFERATVAIQGQTILVTGRVINGVPQISNFWY